MHKNINNELYSAKEIEEFANKVLTYSFDINKLIEASSIKIFRDRMIEYRIYRNITADKLGKRIGLSKQTMSHLETGRTKSIKIKVLDKMKEIENCEPEYLLGFTDKYDKKLSMARRYCHEKKSFEKYEGLIKYVENNYDCIEISIETKRIFKVFMNPLEAVNDDVETLKNEFLKYVDEETELLRYFNSVSKLNNKNKILVKNIIADTLKLIDKYPIYTV